MIFSASLFTGAKHSAFSTSHLSDTNKAKHNYNQEQNCIHLYRKTTIIY